MDDGVDIASQTSDEVDTGDCGRPKDDSGQEATSRSPQFAVRGILLLISSPFCSLG